MNNFDLTQESRKQIQLLVDKYLSEYYSNTKSKKVGRLFEPSEVKKYVSQFNLDQGSNSEDVIKDVIHGLNEFAVHTPHPNYFGLFNPRPSYVSTMADYISATYNPQLAAWSHAPFANEIERKCILELGLKLGFEETDIDGAFCSGGAESNLTSLLCALNNKYPTLAEEGLIGMNFKPVIYLSSEAHHSMHKAARITGLGTNMIRSIKVDENLEMDINHLEKTIQEDLSSGFHPLMTVATTGSTGAGAIDNVERIHAICGDHGIWLHVDAAYGAGMKISTKYKEELGTIHLADSVTIDLHKWFSVPMGASVILVKDKHILKKTFAIQTDYMPLYENDVTIDPYSNSIQWSRRAIGLKFFLPLAVHGWQVFDKTITHQIEMAHYLRRELKLNDWEISNNTPLPIVCFTHKNLKGSDDKVNGIVDRIVESGMAWCSAYSVNGDLSIRACITNYATTTIEIDEFVELVDGLLNW